VACVIGGRRHPFARWAMGRLGSRERCGRSSPGPRNSVIGCTSRGTSSSPAHAAAPRGEGGTHGHLHRPDPHKALEAVPRAAEKSSASEKAVPKITGQLDVLLAYDDFPFEHWVHLRTTNPRESTFSTVRPRTRVTRGSGSRPAALAMADTLLDPAHARWRTITCGELTALVRAGATSSDGKLWDGREIPIAGAPGTDVQDGFVAA
jgi:hypothetical protein